MKWIAWSLLLLNVLLFGYFNLDKAPPVPQLVSHQPIEPEKIKLLMPKDIEALPLKTAESKPAESVPAAPEQLSCYEWGSFSIANLPRARNILTKFSLDATVKQKSAQEATRYWVYLPKMPSLPMAQAKLDELHGLGVNDGFIVLEPQSRYAISMGVFKDEQLATKLLEELKLKGVKSVVKGVRNQENGRASLLISNMSADMAAEIDKLKPDFPGSELKQINCQ